MLAGKGSISGPMFMGSCIFVFMQGTHHKSAYKTLYSFPLRELQKRDLGNRNICLAFLFYKYQNVSKSQPLPTLAFSPSGFKRATVLVGFYKAPLIPMCIIYRLRVTVLNIYDILKIFLSHTSHFYKTNSSEINAAQTQSSVSGVLGSYTRGIEK